ncbi:MAG: hypothetical protein ACE5I1_19120, partial [bacterium]
KAEDHVERNEFDADDTETVTTVMHVHGSAEAQNEKENTQGSQHVFNKIFEEEARADIEILQEAANALQIGLNSNTPLRDIKNTSNSINSTAQLFAFDHIIKLSKAVEMMATYLLSEELELTKDVIHILQSAGKAFQSMVHNDEPADADTQQIVEDINRIINDGVSEENPNPHSGAIHSISAQEWEREREKKSIVPSSEDEAAPKKRKVGEMVDYVRNLLSDEQTNEDLLKEK